MNVFKLYYFLLLCISLCSVNAYSGETDSSVVNAPDFLKNLAKKNPGYTFNFNLPINVYDKNIILNVDIPTDLKLISERPGNPHFMQFGGRSILITVSHQTGGKFRASDLISRIVGAMDSNSEITPLQREEQTYPGYMDGYRIVTLHNIKKDTMDVIYIYAASGPYDSASVIYAMRINKNEKVNEIIQKIKSAFNASVKLIDKSSNINLR